MLGSQNLAESRFLGGGDGLPPPENGPDEVRQLADEVMSRSELQPEPKSLFNRAGDWLSELIGEIIAEIFEQTAGNSVFGWLILGAVVGLIVFLLFRFSRGTQLGARVSTPAIEGIDPKLSAAELDQQADKCEQEGDWQGAIRLRYGALVVTLIERDVVAEMAGRTTGEYRRELSDSVPDASPSFGEASDLFDLVFYAGREADAWDAGNLRQAKDRVLKAAR